MTQTMYKQPPNDILGELRDVARAKSNETVVKANANKRKQHKKETLRDSWAIMKQVTPTKEVPIDIWADTSAMPDTTPIKWLLAEKDPEKIRQGVIEYMNKKGT
jgi:hypothetical protein